MGKRYNIHLLTPGTSVVRLEDEISIGKFGQSINVDHPDISTKHCTFYLNDDVLFIKDHGSDKGTFVNGNQVPPDQPIVITLDDQVALGSVKVNVEAVVEVEKKEDGAPPPLPNVPTDMLDDVIEVKESVERTKTDRDKTMVLSTDSLITEINEESIKPNEKPVIPKNQDPSLSKNKDYDDTEMANTVNLKTLKKEKVLANPDETHAHTLQMDIQTKVTDIEWGVPFIVRFGAFIIDINIVIFLTLYLIEHGTIEGLSFLSALLSSLFSLFFDHAADFLGSFGAVFFLITLISNLIMKRSIGQLITRISVEGKGPIARARAAGRSCLAFILGPFVVFDIPGLLSKPTVKEVLCLSRFYLKSPFVSYGLVAVFLPISFVLGYYTSFFERGPLDDFQRFEFNTINIVGQAPNSKKIYSEYFHFEKPKRSNLFIEYPEFLTIRKENKRFFAPAMGIYYPNEKLLARFEKKPGVNLKKMLSYAVRGNPLASFKFPEIVKFENGKAINDGAFIEEVKNLVKASLELSSGNSFNHLLSFGPFFKSFFDFRDSLLSTIDQRVEAVQFIRIGGRHFMMITPPSGKFTEESSRSQVLLPIGSFDSPVFSFNFKSLKNGSDQAYLNFYRHFFSGVRWDNNIKFNLSDSLGAYEIIDYFQNIPEGNVKEYHKQIFRYYYIYGRRLVRTKNTEVREDFIAKTNSLLKMIIGLNQSERKKNDRLQKGDLEGATYDHLIKKINETVEALKSQNLNFFGLGGNKA